MVRGSARELDFVPIGCRPLDKLLGGGVPTGQISLIHGEAGSGKSAIALSCAVSCARMGAEALYIDADWSLSGERLKAMTKRDPEVVLKRISICLPENFYELSVILENLEYELGRGYGLVVVDSISGLYRAAISILEDPSRLNKELNRQLALLTQVAKSLGVAVLLTSQIRASLEGGGFFGKVEPVASRALDFWSANVLNLRSTGRRGVRSAFLLKRNWREVKGASCLFRISECGVSEV